MMKGNFILLKCPLFVKASPLPDNFDHITLYFEISVTKLSNQLLSSQKRGRDLEMMLSDAQVSLEDTHRKNERIKRETENCVDLSDHDAAIERLQRLVPHCTII